MITFFILLCIVSILVGASRADFTPAREFLIDENINAPHSLSPFTHEFLLKLQKSEELFNILFLGIEDSKDYTVSYSVVYNTAIELNSCDPNKFATAICDSFNAVLDIMTPMIWGQILSASIERLLNEHGITTKGKASEFAEQMSNNIKNEASKIVSKQLPGDFLNAVALGATKFVRSFITISPEAAETISNYLSKEYKALKYYKFSNKFEKNMKLFVQ